MEQVRAREQVQYASLGWRFAAIAVDTVVLFFLLVVIFAVLAAAGALDLKDPAFSGGIDLQRTAPVWMYARHLRSHLRVLHGLRGAHRGQRGQARLSHARDHGRRHQALSASPSWSATSSACPKCSSGTSLSGISCLANPRNKRLGDLAARTVVVRRSAAPAGVVATGTAFARPGAAPLPPAPGPARSATGVVTGVLTAGVHGARRQRGSRRAQDGGARRARRAPQLPALLGGRAGQGGAARPARTSAAERARAPAAGARVFAGVRGRLVHARRRRHRHAAGACGRDRGGDPRGHDAAGRLRRLSPTSPTSSASSSPTSRPAPTTQVHDAYMSVARGETTA